jgi:hypothetical protein
MIHSDMYLDVQGEEAGFGGVVSPADEMPFALRQLMKGQNGAAEMNP